MPLEDHDRIIEYSRRVSEATAIIKGLQHDLANGDPNIVAPLHFCLWALWLLELAVIEDGIKALRPHPPDNMSDGTANVIEFPHP